MSFVQVILHCVWSTKNRFPYLSNKQHREDLFSHIIENATTKEIIILKIGGYEDHIHLSILLDKNMDIASILQYIKGEAAFWNNKKYKKKIEWQDDYFAVSVSESQKEILHQYIANQEEHHQEVTSQEEYDRLIALYHKEDKN